MKKYLIAGILVEATKSAGGGFYDVVLPNGEKTRYLADVFETVAVPYTGQNTNPSKQE